MVCAGTGDWSKSRTNPRTNVSWVSGVMRARFNTVDGQLYLCGLKGWQTRGTKDGIFQRVRYTGATVVRRADGRGPRRSAERDRAEFHNGERQPDHRSVDRSRARNDLSVERLQGIRKSRTDGGLGAGGSCKAGRKGCPDDDVEALFNSHDSPSRKKWGLPVKCAGGG